MSATEYAGSAGVVQRRRKVPAMTAQERIGAMAGVLFCWGTEQRNERLAELRAREMELEIERLRAVGGC